MITVNITPKVLILMNMARSLFAVTAKSMQKTRMHVHEYEN